jgi:hypothetical protein
LMDLLLLASLLMRTWRFVPNMSNPILKIIYKLFLIVSRML